MSRPPTPRAAKPAERAHRRVGDGCAGHVVAEYWLRYAALRGFSRRLCGTNTGASPNRVGLSRFFSPGMIDSGFLKNGSCSRRPNGCTAFVHAALPPRKSPYLTPWSERLWRLQKGAAPCGSKFKIPRAISLRWLSFPYSLPPYGSVALASFRRLCRREKVLI